MSTRAIIYTRYSPRRNSEECESCEVQLAYCEQHAHKKGYTIEKTFEDRAVSGKDEDRPGMWAAIEHLERGDVLLVMKHDRLARNVYLSELVRRAVETVGARIEAVQGDVEGDGPEHVMIRQVLASIAEYERKITALRTKYAMLHHQKNGRRMGRYAPYGFAVDPDDPKRLTPVGAEQVALERIVELHGQGKNTCEIARVMNSEMPELARGEQWVPKTIRKIVGRL
jgi:DNA invertase Pin-like site-specific DNA recombinase